MGETAVCDHTSHALRHSIGWPDAPSTRPPAGQRSRRSAVQPPCWQYRPEWAVLGWTSRGMFALSKMTVYRSRAPNEFSRNCAWSVRNGLVQEILRIDVLEAHSRAAPAGAPGCTASHWRCSRACGRCTRPFRSARLHFCSLCGRPQCRPSHCAQQCASAHRAPARRCC